jgi:hypothetical protein
MSGAMGGRFDPNDPLVHSPEWVSKVVSVEKQRVDAGPRANYAEIDFEPEEVDFEQDIPTAAYQVGRSREFVGLIVISAAAVAAVVACFMVEKLQPTWAAAASGYIENSPTFRSWISGQPVGQATAGAPIEQAKPAAQLIVGQASSRGAGEALPLNVSLSNGPADAMIVINGLAAGWTLTVGRALGADSWQVMAAELHDAVVRPPQGFAGAMELGLELRLANDSVADRKTLRLEWVAPAGSQTTRPALVARHLDSDEVAALLKRGEGFIASGDLASARLVFQRAAEAGEAQAALLLAGTYDPIALQKLGLQGPKADVEKARTWYQRAQELGSAAAPGRLQLLAGYDR